MFTTENAAALGRRGGQTTATRHGADHMAAIGQRGCAATLAKYDAVSIIDLPWLARRLKPGRNTWRKRHPHGLPPEAA